MQTDRNLFSGRSAVQQGGEEGEGEVGFHGITWGLDWFNANASR